MPPEPSPPETYFARAGRTREEELREQAEQCINSPIARAVLESLDGLVVVLNADRQIIAVNAALLEALREEGLEDPLGMRWGEASHCVHAPEGPDGCGTSRACRYCGAALAIQAAQESHGKVEGECRMTIRRGGKLEAREFQLKATPLRLPFGEVLVPVFHDVSDRNRREILEAAFLHDLSNTLSALSCWSDMMKIGAIDAASAAARIVDISAQLSTVVDHQRLLLQAEKGLLRVEASAMETGAFLDALRSSLAANPQAMAKGLSVAVRAGSERTVRTDPTLLIRILSNMGINAIEAALPGDAITLAWNGRGFSVHNPGFIPEEIALQIFQRSFSTKARTGRGLGTYSMKILGENVLGGSVGFRTSPEAGTEFFIQLPGPASEVPAGH